MDLLPQVRPEDPRRSGSDAPWPMRTDARSNGNARTCPIEVGPPKLTRSLSKSTRNVTFAIRPIPVGLYLLQSSHVHFHGMSFQDRETTPVLPKELVYMPACHSLGREGITQVSC